MDSEDALFKKLAKPSFDELLNEIRIKKKSMTFSDFWKYLESRHWTYEEYNNMSLGRTLTKRKERLFK